ncbi:MAG: hypothetical protein QGH47_04005 [Candidatus Woesearchaeota archaeon]|jgi:uncharacterized repeat protein (TIGR01451 family)|nr:hypothetical protein [Candidatus Woesearchaeota archaeon]
MRNKIIYLLVFLLVINIASAAKEQIFSGFISSTETIMVSGLNVSAASYGEPPTKAVIKIGPNTEIVDLDDCSIRENLEVCFNDYEEGDYDYDKQKQTFNVNVKISQNVGKVTIIREIETKKLDIGDETKITVTLKNDEDKEVTNVHLSDAFPPGIQLLSTDLKCKKEGNGVTWDGDLKAGDEHKCSYMIKIKEAVDTKLTATVQYNNGVADQSIESDTITIRVKNEFFNTVISMDKSSVELNKKVKAYINVTNIKDSSITVDNLQVTLPSHFKLVNMDPDLTEDLTWNGAISKNKTRSFTLGLRAEKTGSLDLIVDIDVNFNNVPLTFQTKKPFTVETPSLKVRSSFGTFQFNSGEEIPVKFELTNPTDFGFKNVQYDVTSSLASFVDASDEGLTIANNESLSIYSKTLKFPAVEETLDVEIHVTYSYDTYGGETLRGNYTEFIFVLPGEQIDREETPNVVAPSVTQETVSSESAKPVEEENVDIVTEPEDATVTEESSGVSNFLLGIISALVVFVVVIVFVIGRTRKKLKSAPKEEPKGKKVDDKQKVKKEPDISVIEDKT